MCAVGGQGTAVGWESDDELIWEFAPEDILGYVGI
jgi:hypothetical protein